MKRLLGISGLKGRFFTGKQNSNPNTSVGVIEEPGTEKLAEDGIFEENVQKEKPIALEEIPLEDVNSQMAEIFREEYVRLAKEIGLNFGPALNETIKSFLIREKIKVYNYAGVARFLKERYGEYTDEERKTEEKPGWDWRPLTRLDRDANQIFTVHGAGVSGQLNNTRLYGHEIPLFVLRLAHKIRTEIPGALLYVSDANVPNPDPFLMVTGHGRVESFIIAHWNEPGFEDKKNDE